MSNYITSTKILAVFLIILSIITSISLAVNGNPKTKKPGEIIWGLIGTLIHCLLFYGAHKKNKVVITSWIVLACVELIIPIYFLVLQWWKKQTGQTPFIGIKWLFSRVRGP